MSFTASMKKEEDEEIVFVIDEVLPADDDDSSPPPAASAPADVPQSSLIVQPGLPSETQPVADSGKQLQLHSESIYKSLRPCFS